MWEPTACFMKISLKLIYGVKFVQNSAVTLHAPGDLSRASVPIRKLDFRASRLPDSKQTTVSFHYIFIISQLWLTSHPRSSLVLLDAGTPRTSREIYSEDDNGETRTRNPSVINEML